MSQKQQDRTQLIDVIMKLQQSTHLYKKNSIQLRSQIEDQHRVNQEMEAQNRSELLHLETVHLMSKYQLIYIKLNTCLTNWSRHTTANQRTLKLKKAFEIMKAKAAVHREAQACQKKLIANKVRFVFANLVETYKHCNKSRL